MTGFFRYVLSRHRTFGLVTLLAFGVLIVCLVDVAGKARHVAHPGNQSRPIEVWMSLRYVERSWDIGKPALFGIIGYDVDTPPDEVPRSVAEVLRESGMTLPEFQARIEDAQHQRREHSTR